MFPEHWSWDVTHCGVGVNQPWTFCMYYIWVQSLSEGNPVPRNLPSELSVADTATQLQVSCPYLYEMELCRFRNLTLTPTIALTLCLYVSD